ncbi:hypothetical protein FBU30_008991, partial [Linnemannia zychae]
GVWKLEITPNASAYRKRDYFLKVFKDPPNAEELSTRRSINSNITAITQGESSNRTCRLLQFNTSCTNFENIFKAVLFLYTHIPEKAHLEDESFVFGLTKDSPSFKDLAAGLASTEPSLCGVTAHALISLYERIIKERNALDDFLIVATGLSWTDTRMSDMALTLAETDRELRDRENRQLATRNEAKRQAVTEAQAFEKQIVMTMLGSSNTRKRTLQEDESDETDGESDGNDAETDDLQQDVSSQPESSTVSNQLYLGTQQQDTYIPSKETSTKQPNLGLTTTIQSNIIHDVYSDAIAIFSK